MEYEDFKKQQDEASATGAVIEPRPAGVMTLRERFQRVMHYQTVDLLPNFEFGYWAETLPNWHRQGLPETVTNWEEAYAYFGIEKASSSAGYGGLMFCEERGLIEDRGDTLVERDAWGAICEINKEGNRSIPRYLEYPVHDRASWVEVRKERLDKQDGRFPDNWDELVEEYRHRDYPLGVGIGSLIGVPRNLIGFENIAMMVLEQPELVEEIVEDLCQAVERALVRALREVQYDFACGWEDICFNSGPIVGVDFFRDVVAPRFKRITDLLHLHGVDIVQTDCDGNLTHIMPHLLDAGVNTTFPTEVHAGTDPVPLRKQYGRQLRLWGGVDKMILLKDKAAIDRELQRLLPVVEEGGFIPHIDHLVQANASLDLYKHYLDRKREWFRVGGEPKY